MWFQKRGSDLTVYMTPVWCCCVGKDVSGRQGKDLFETPGSASEIRNTVYTQPHTITITVLHIVIVIYTIVRT